ncbi:kinase-like domain-containing protein [Glomus cerebriforme]|uniref:Kinase-like domain-containing protein n=1 Tax=Glomus cerebriforme TaxID=658196 RepID=A0A397SJV2_9GLOM|nr:kinase-like domain-containing protein [Glomus cerebriforme]
METIAPQKIVEWIPYNNLQNISYLTKGGCSEIYTADWVDGPYHKWDNRKQRLRRLGKCEVILKRLENVESANRSWFDEGKSHLTISNKWSLIVKCYGLTKDPSNGIYMLVLRKMDMDLREYLRKNHHKMTWKDRIIIILNITEALSRIHKEKAIHRDLHSGNILYLKLVQSFYISDLGFCGPVNKPLNSIYGNLPYIAPEVIAGSETTFASDIYSFAILMWEISSGHPPFSYYEHNYDFVIKILNGMRPKVVMGTPLEYEKLMKQCWDADPTKRPDINYLYNEVLEMKKLYHQNKNNEQQINSQIINNCTNSSSSVNSLIRNFSKIHIFKDLPEQRNATEAYYSNDSLQHNLSIPNNIEDIVFEQSQQTEQNDFTTIENKDEVKGKSKRIYSNEEEDIVPNNNNNNNKSKKIKLNNHDKDIDDDEITNNPNFHSEDQDELEIPEEIIIVYKTRYKKAADIRTLNPDDGDVAGDAVNAGIQTINIDDESDATITNIDKYENYAQADGKEYISCSLIYKLKSRRISSG